MSKGQEQANKKPHQNQNNHGGNVVQMPARCPVCEKKASRSSFCDEHFIWFKQGLINRKGEKPKDFDKKYQAFMRKTKQAA